MASAICTLQILYGFYHRTHFLIPQRKTDKKNQMEAGTWHCRALGIIYCIIYNFIDTPADKKNQKRKHFPRCRLAYGWVLSVVVWLKAKLGGG